MELVQGPTLQDKLDDENVIAPRFAFRIAAQIARALEAAHDEKIVHRDVKPANVILSGRPGDETVKVVDFGLAAQQDMNRVGTPLFMSPEAAQGKRIDEKSDVYALGVCLYRMLTGELPFTGTTVKEILAAHVSAELTPPSAKRPQLGKAYDELLKKLLVKSKGYRPTAAEAADLLEDVADDLEEREAGVRRVRRRRKKAPAKRPARANPALWAGLAVAGVVVVIAAMLMSGKDKTPVPPSTGGQTPAVQVVDPAQKAYEDTDRFIAENPANPAEAVRRWGQLEQKYPGTKWATMAGVKRAEAQAALDAKEAAALEAEKKRKEAEAARNDPVRKFDRYRGLVKAFQFSDASDLLTNEDLPPPPGVSDATWTCEGNRLDYLAKHFVNRMDAGFSSAKPPYKAKEMFPAAKEGDVLVGATRAGAIVFDGKEKRTLEWSGAAADAFFKNRVFVDKVLHSTEEADNLVLACLAMVLGQPPKVSRNFQDNVRSIVNDTEEADAKLRPLFGE